MGNYETHDLAPVRDDERKELNLSRRITFKQFSKHINGEFHEACLTEIPWSIRDSISLYERMNASFNAISDIPPELPLRLPHLNFLDLSFNQIEGLPESFGLLFHLRTLLLRHNKLKSLPLSFVHLVKLEKVDLSSNMLKELPEDIGKMEHLNKLNVSGNKLKTLPLSLGNSKTLTVLLALKNRLQDPSQSICDNGSEATINFLQKRYKTSVPSVQKRPVTPLNEFPRVRGNQLQSSVPNPHSAHVQYIQTQTHTTNTPSRIKTPLLPPLGSSQLDADVLRDRVVGMIYGAAIGDAIGIATRGLSDDDCAFHYSKENITYSEIVQDGHRVRWRPGDWTSNFDLFALVFDSVISWAGVVDELDFAKRLVHWCERGFPELGDSEGIILSETIYKVTSDKSFLEHPQTAAKKVLSHNVHLNGDKMNGNVTMDDERSSISSISSMSSENGNTPAKPSMNSIYKTYTRSDSTTSLTISGCDNIGVDNGAIVRTAILGVPSFHDITEVTNNVIRICSSTHADGKCLASSVLISVIVAVMLQGKHDLNSMKGIEELINIAQDCGRPFLHTTDDKADFEYYCSIQDLERLRTKEKGKMGYTMKPLGAALVGLRSRLDFRSYIMQLILQAGDSNSNACVAGAILGCKVGFSQLPKDWVSGLRKKQTTWLNTRINHLLDMLGLP